MACLLSNVIGKKMKTPLARLFSEQRRHCLFSDRSPKDRNVEKLILPQSPCLRDLYLCLWSTNSFFSVSFSESALKNRQQKKSAQHQCTLQPDVPPTRERGSMTRPSFLVRETGEKMNWIIWHFFNKIHWKAFKGPPHIGKFPKREEMIVFKISTDMLAVVMTKTEMLLILCVCDYIERLDESMRDKMEIRERRWF